MEKCIVICGPTATGKSALAVELALRYNGEIISADSRQIYRGLDIGSAKITVDEMQGIPHHMTDIADPRENFTVAEFQHKARAIITDIHTRGKIPIICGGTGMYIDALVFNTSFPQVTVDKDLRKELEQKTTGELFTLLETIDPVRAKTIDPYNPRRLIRAIEIATALGNIPPSPHLEEGSDLTDDDKEYGLISPSPKLGEGWGKVVWIGFFSTLKRFYSVILAYAGIQNSQSKILDSRLHGNDKEMDAVSPSPSLGEGWAYLHSKGEVVWIGLTLPKEELQKNISDRIQKRIPALFDEIKKLHTNNISWERLDSFGLEYRYGAQYVQGLITLEEFKELLATKTWQFAKRQMTWFKRNTNIHWYHPISEKEKILKHVQDFVGK